MHPKSRNPENRDVRVLINDRAAADSTAPPWKHGLLTWRQELIELPPEVAPGCVGMERKLPKPGFWMAVLLVGLVLLVQVILAVPLAILDIVVERLLHRPPPQLERQPLMIGGMNVVAFAVAIAL